MTRDPGVAAESADLVRRFTAHPTLDALKASAEWPELAPRLDRLLSTVRLHEPPLPPGPPHDAQVLRAVHWNIEHGNWYEQVEDALLHHPDLRDADMLMFNEIDLGMARAGNRDVTADLCRALHRYGAWAPMFLESTAGRDDDPRVAAGRANEEAMFGIAVLSRWPIGAVHLVGLPGPEAIQFDVERMFGRFIALVAEIQRPGAPFVAVSVHLEVHRTRAHRAEQIRVLAHALRNEKRPIVLAGDFNSHTFDRGLWHSPITGSSALMLYPGALLRRRLLHPDRGRFREPLFDGLREAGFQWEPFVDFQPTLRLRLGRIDEGRTWLNLLGPLTQPLLGWAERRGALRLDWFAGRGWRGGRGITVQGLDGPGLAADHAPIVAEFE
jgi:endonuclease/exonuclease/phosphatase family metal-dependent hydrolase